MIQVAQNLENKYLNSAPKANREKTKRIIQIYKNNRSVTRNIPEKVVMALYLPSAFGHVGKKGKPGKADEIYEDLVSRYQESDAEQNEMNSEIKRNYQLRVVLFTQARKQDPDRKPLPQDEATERHIEQRLAEIRPSQVQGAAAILDGVPDGQGQQRHGHQSAE